MSTQTQALRALFAQVPANSTATARAIDRDDIRLALRKAREAKRRVRVYSDAGFVPNSYRWTCKIQYVEVVKTPDGQVRAFTGWTGAQRSNASGARVVVQ